MNTYNIVMNKDNYANFQKELQAGQEGEDLVAAFFEKRGNTIVDTARDKGLFKDWDIKIQNPQGKQITVEVKTDKTNSSNLAIEYKSRGIPSGIFATKADIYLIYFVNDATIYTINSADLRLWLLENSPKRVKTKVFDSDSWMFLVPKTIFTAFEVK